MRSGELATMPCHVGFKDSSDGRTTARHAVVVLYPVLISSDLLYLRNLQSVLRGIQFHVDLSAIAMQTPLPPAMYRQMDVQT
jgi:hypothetical protein